MIKVRLAYDDNSDARYRLLREHLGPVLLDAYKEDNHKERKKAFELKSYYGAREVPFAALEADGKPVKGWWSEDNSFDVTAILDYVYDYIQKNAKHGVMTITKIEGTNNEKYSEGHTESGYCKVFTEGLSCRLETASRWYQTSIITEIDWDKQIFKTMNSTYKFTLNESKDNKKDDE